MDSIVGLAVLWCLLLACCIGPVATASTAPPKSPSTVGARAAAPQNGRAATTAGAALNTSLARTIEAAYIYAYPIVDMYSILYQYSLDLTSPGYKGPINHIIHLTTLATPNDTGDLACQG